MGTFWDSLINRPMNYHKKYNTPSPSRGGQGWGWVCCACKRPEGIKAQTRIGGFTYVGLLFLVAIMGIVMATAATLWSFVQQREKERELLFVGNQFRRAIGLYYERTPGTVKKYPQSLEDLLLDKRFIIPQRYLRQIYRDPMTGSKDWGLVMAPEGGIMGIYSPSQAATIKRGSFRYVDRLLEGQGTYAEWKFVYQPVGRGA